MKRLAIAIGVIAAGVIAGGQTIQPTGGGGSSTITSGSTATSGFSAGQIPFSTGSVLQGSSLIFTKLATNGTLTVVNPITSTATTQIILQDANGNGNISIQEFANATGNNILFAGVGNSPNVLFGSPNNSTAGVFQATNAIFGWASVGSSPDTAISRHTTPGVVDIGTGGFQSTAGGLQTGNATLISLTTGTNADFLCLNAGGGILIQSTACTISSLRFKPDWKPYTDHALTKVSGLDVGTFHLQTGPNADPNAKSLQAGLSAESIAAIAPECAVYENDMKTPKSYRQECVIALLVKAIQELKNDRHHQ